MSSTPPRVVEEGWTRQEFIFGAGELLTYPDGRVRFAHVCDRGGRGVIVCAPALQLGQGHTLTRDDQGRPTVRASILCSDCGTHGWITNGTWEAA